MRINPNQLPFGGFFRFWSLNMATTVEITLGDDGTLTVGIADQPSTDLDAQQPAANIQQALKMAGHLLQSPPPAAAGAGAPTDPNAGAPGGSATAGPPPSAGAGDGSGQSATDMWNQMAAGTPAN